ncbi:3-oxoacyl-[acyl-carrier-protein] reductase [Purpureocillium takamizusanense]|uniref:3-oxoacyl-[acyl-carrier-protein] reductase n=1 Tax=Purpureocillium takamizusanense TaxID=2060973 RepID=A0A9Q8QJF4_9HYPO|nr:3-oxoacyl-[acyl-carrier-protein] reductase [Purpureocillium takamizusanense]UNI19921.1 3-oxoacyl-[acyl-carrier-protein] reductase [Purpureocillium takamizusanense]
MTPLSLAGKHCAVVGGTGHIGFHIAKAFASRGAVVTVLGRSALEARPKLEPKLVPYSPPPPAPSSDDAPAPRSSPPEPLPASHRFLRLDLSDPANIKTVFYENNPAGAEKFGDRHVGPLDILVNCAGIAQTTLLSRTSNAELASIIDTNLLAPMLVCKNARLRRNGCIINVSSLMANRAELGVTAYAASKAGLIGACEKHTYESFIIAT